MKLAVFVAHAEGGFEVPNSLIVKKDGIDN
jgi:hypothetical protein